MSSLSRLYTPATAVAAGFDEDDSASGVDKVTGGDAAEEAAETEDEGEGMPED